MPIVLPRRLAARIALASLLAGGSAALSAPRNDLTAAGFVSRPADTRVRQAMLVRLPPHRLIVRRNGRRLHYAYADPAGCDCLYVGGTRAYRRYLRRVPQAPAPVGYVDGQWDWDAWGGFVPRFTWGPGFGWGDRPRMDLGTRAP